MDQEELRVQLLGKLKNKCPLGELVDPAAFEAALFLVRVQGGQLLS